MSGTSDNLGLIEVADNQTQKERAFNTSINAIDNAMNRGLVVAFTANARTITAAEFTRNVGFSAGGHTAAAMLTVPLTSRLFLVRNLSGSHTIDVGGATGATVEVAASSTVLVWCDGVDCSAAASSGSGGGGGFLPLTNGDPADPKIMFDAEGDVIGVPQ